MTTMAGQKIAAGTSLWHLPTNDAVIATSTTMAEEQHVAASPESLPSLAALSQTSTDGDDNLELEYEIPAAMTIMSEDDMAATSWPSPEKARLATILDEDDCSSGILSSETIDLDVCAKESDSEHSFASMATLKSPSGRFSYAGPPTTNPVFETVDVEDINVNRACHGALNINPKQLAEVFALFKPDLKSHPKPGQTPTDPPGIPTIELAQVTSSRVPPSAPQVDDPLRREEAPRTMYATSRKLTAELYWKPRAKNLEHECDTLREIIKVDSSKILRLKTALAAQSAALVSFKEQLRLTNQELYSLQKDKEALLENETDYRETIRILKHEVDILTRDGQGVPDRNFAPTNNSLLSQEELQQLRLENQLFAAQIVEYETELERLSQEVDAFREEELCQKNEPQATSASSDEQISDRDMRDTRAAGSMRGSDELFSFARSPPVGPVTQNKHATIARKSDQAVTLQEEKTSKERGELTKLIRKNPEEENCHQESRLEELPVEVPYRMPQHIFGTVLGMFTLGGNGEEKEAKDEVFVVQESKVPSDDAHCLLWTSSDGDPTYMKAQSIDAATAATDQVEARDPPPIERDDTAVEVLQNHDATLDIEVQLSPYPNEDKQHESVAARGSSYSGPCDENCGAWSIVSDCFSSSEPN